MRHTDVAIVGSGFGGLGAAIRLKQDGVDDFVILERASDVGGTWRDNTYPGCACDVESHLYSFSFALEPGWSCRFSRQPEIWRYLQRCAGRFGVLPHIRFHHEMRGASWDESERRWRIDTSQGPLTARLLVLASGPLSVPVVPDLPGVERFEGRAFHSAQWDHAFDLTGRGVAVIGTGASAAQFVPEIQKQVAALYLFQRTPAWVMPRPDGRIPEWRRRLYARFPPVQRAVRGLIYLYRELSIVLFRHPAMMRRAQRMALRHLHTSIADPALRAKLTPSYTMGCKRVLLSNDFYLALAQPNVEVITSGVAEVRARSIVAADGVERPVDAIIYGTGFRATDPPLAAHIRGRDGRTLSEIWGGSPRALGGTSVAGFPNFFILLGPNTGLGHNSVVYMTEAQLDHLIGAVRHMRERGLDAIEPTEEAQSGWVAAIDRRMRGTVWVAGGCSSWYLDRTGRNSAIWPDSSWSYYRRVARFRPEHYTTSPRRWFMPGSPAADRVQCAAARLLARLPPRVQIALSGEPPIVIDGQRLDPQVQLLRSIRRRRGVPGLIEPTIAAGRERYRRETRAFRGPMTGVDAVRDSEIPGPAGVLRVRHYAPIQPSAAGPAPLMVYLHGGGFVLGDLDTHDEPCRILCRHAGVHVLSVDYRLAPEHPFPAAVEDAEAAFAWARAHAAPLGADPERVTIGGDSAGANLAAVAAIAGRGGGPAAQLLIYPPTDVRTRRRSHQLFGEGFLLTLRDCDAFFHHYSDGTGTRADDPRVSPLKAPDLSSLPPALVVLAGFDVLRDEGEAYARALQAAGSVVRVLRFPDLEHGFVHLTGVCPAAAGAMVAIAREWSGLIARRPAQTVHAGSAGRDSGDSGADGT